MDLSLKCKCGNVQGTLSGASPKRVSHIICMCDDCQMFAHFLERGKDILDEHGGTEIVQTTPAQLTIETGQEHMRSMRLSPNGLVRWFTSCCQTPLGNTMASAKVPFVGIPLAFLHDAGGKEHLAEAIGPVRAKLQGKYGKGDLPADCHQAVPLGFLLKTGGWLLSAWLRGGARPSPFFRDDGARVSEPEVLEPARRDTLHRQVASASS